MKKPFWPGATVAETVAYTVLENHPDAYAAFGDATLQVVLSARQMRSPTTLGAHATDPSLKKMAVFCAPPPAGWFVNTDSPV
jgi:hypothetical protein